MFRHQRASSRSALLCAVVLTVLALAGFTPGVGAQEPDGADPAPTTTDAPALASDVDTLAPADTLPPATFDFRFAGGPADQQTAIRAAGGIWSNLLSSTVPIRVDVRFQSLGAVLSALNFAPPGGGIASVFYPPNNQLEAFLVGNDGAVYVVWKAQNGLWNLPVRLTATGAASPGAPLSAVFYPVNNQLEVFYVGTDGALRLLWKANNGTWQGPVGLTAPNVLPARGSVAAAFYPLNNQLEVLFADTNGVVNVVWKANNGAWNQRVGLTAANTAPAGAPIALTYYPPNNQLEAHFIAPNGAMTILWKAQNGAWQRPVGITAAGLAPAGSVVTATYYPTNNQLEAFVVNGAGALSLVWKANNGAWQGPIGLSAPGFAVPGGGLASAHYPTNNQLEVVVAGNDGRWYVAWKANNGAWNAPVGLSSPNQLTPGARVTLTAYPLNSQLEALAVDTRGSVSLVWKANNGAWQAPTGVLASASATQRPVGDTGKTPMPLAEATAGSNLNDDNADITMTVNSNARWYTGLDGVVPANTFDLVSVALHELGHGLGFDSSTCFAGDSGCDASTRGTASVLEGKRKAVPYTTFLENAAGTRLDTITNGTTLAGALTSGQVFWGGAAGRAAAGNQRPRINAPGTWAPGSSIAHLDEATYASTGLNALMTPAIGPAEANQQPGVIALGVLADLGWKVRTYAHPPAANSTWAAYQPLGDQLEVFTVRSDGALTLRWKAENGAWNAPIALSAAGLAPANAPVASVFQPLNNQLETFVVGNDGAVYLVWKAQNGRWNAPIRLTDTRVAAPGAPLAGVFQPVNNQLEVLYAGTDGAINLLWKAQNGAWNRPIRLTPAGATISGAALAASFYPPNNQLEVLYIDAAGGLRVLWKANNGAWNVPAAISPAGVAPPGAPLSLTYQPLNNQLEAFYIGNDGALRVSWKANNGAWQGPVALTAGGVANPRGWVASAFQPLNQQLELFFVDAGGALRVAWKVRNGTWAPPVRLTGAGFAAPGQLVAASYYTLGAQLEVFVSSPTGAVNLLWKSLNSSWRPPVPIG